VAVIRVRLRARERRLRKCQIERQSASPSPAPSSPPGVVIIPPDSPKLAQIRVEPIKLEAMPAGEVTAPGKVEVNLNRVSRVPLPVAGRVMRVLVKLGDSVAAGQPLLVLEAMKMEQTVAAPAAGVVAELRAKAGEQVAAGQVLAVVEPCP